MKHQLTLMITSLISILLATFHISDDVVRGFEPGGFKNISAMVILALWLYGTLMLSGRRWGYVIMLLGSALGTLMPMAHMRGAGMVGGRVAGSDGIHFFVWTLIALGATSTFSLVLSARGLWSLRGPAKAHP